MALDVLSNINVKSVAIYSVKPMLPEGLRTALSDNFFMPELFRSVEALENHIIAADPVLVVVDTEPPVSLKVLRELTSLASNRRFVVWTDTVSLELVSCWLSAGIRGVISTSASPEAIIRCLNEVAEGRLWIDRRFSNGLLAVAENQRFNHQITDLARSVRGAEETAKTCP